MTELCDNQAERGALGAVLLEGNRFVHHGRDVLKLPAEAWTGIHRDAWGIMLDMLNDNQPIDMLTFLSRVRTAGLGEKISYCLVNEWVEECMTPSRGDAYFRIIREKFVCRRVVEECQVLQSEASKTEDSRELLASASKRFGNIIDDVVVQKTPREVMETSIMDWRNADARKTFNGLATPWKSLNQILGGLRTGLYFIAGRPSEGKTTVEDQLSTFVAATGVHVARATNDSTMQELLERSMGRKANVSISKLNRGNGGEANFAQIEDAKTIIENYPMYFLEQATQIDEIVAWGRMMKSRHDIGMLTLDFIQNVNTGDSKVDMFEQQKVAYVSNKMRALAFELKIPVVVLSQLNRACETDKREPQMSDMRGSGTLEQDATAIIFVYADKDVAPEMNTSGYPTIFPTWLDVKKNKGAEKARVPTKVYRMYFRVDEDDSWVPKEN